MTVPAWTLGNVIGFTVRYGSLRIPVDFTDLTGFFTGPLQVSADFASFLWTLGKTTHSGAAMTSGTRHYAS